MNDRNKNLSLFGLLVSCSILIALVFSIVIMTPESYYNTYNGQLEITRINEMISSQLKTQWFLYFFIFFSILVKCLLVALTLQVGLLIIDFKLGFGKTFSIALTAEFVFLLPQLIKIAWFLIIKTDYTLTEVQQFYPLSLLNLFDVKNLPNLLIYPFQTFNVFEFMYWILLAGGIRDALDIDINQGIKVVFSGYIPALVLWIIFLMFIIVTYGSAT